MNLDWNFFAFRSLARERTVGLAQSSVSHASGRGAADKFLWGSRPERKVGLTGRPAADRGSHARARARARSRARSSAVLYCRVTTLQ